MHSGKPVVFQLPCQDAASTGPSPYEWGLTRQEVRNLGELLGRGGGAQERHEGNRS